MARLRSPKLRQLRRKAKRKPENRKSELIRPPSPQSLAGFSLPAQSAAGEAHGRPEAGEDYSLGNDTLIAGKPALALH